MERSWPCVKNTLNFELISIIMTLLLIPMLTTRHISRSLLYKVVLCLIRIQAIEIFEIPNYMFYRI